MDEQNVVRLSAGARIWWHGDYWEVQRLLDGAALSSQEGEHVEALAVTIRRVLDNPAPLAPGSLQQQRVPPGVPPLKLAPQ